MKVKTRQILWIVLIALVMSCRPTEENRIPKVTNGILDNGIYDVKFISYDDNPSIYENFQLTVNGFEYGKKFKDGRQENGIIEIVYSDILFKLTDCNAEQIPYESLNDFQKKLYMGPSCFELMEKNGDTLKFRTTFTGQLHVEINRGVIVKNQ